MSENRMTSGSEPKDALDGRLARYLDWEAQQVGGAGAGAEMASSIAARRTASGRSGRNPALVFAVVAMALIVAATAIAIAGRPPQQLVVVPSIEVSAPPTAVPVSDPSATEPPVTAAPDPNCLQLGAGDVYSARVGTLPVGVEVPAGPDGTWRGEPDAFVLGKGSCDPTDASPFFRGSLVAAVYANVCHWKDLTLEVPTAFDAAGALARDSGPAAAEAVDTRIGAFRATRLDIEVPSDFDASACDDGELRLWGDERIVPGIPTQVYVAEVDGTTLVITVSYDPAASTPADLEQIDAILASLRVDM